MDVENTIEIETDHAEIHRIGFRSNGSLITIGTSRSASAMISCWNWDSSEKLFEVRPKGYYEGHIEKLAEIREPVIEPAGNRIAMMYNRQLAIYNHDADTTDRWITAWPPTGRTITDLAASSDARMIVAVQRKSDDVERQGLVTYDWALSVGPLIDHTTPHASSFSNLVVAPNGEVAITGGDALRIWDLGERRVVRTVNIKRSQIEAEVVRPLGVSGDGHSVTAIISDMLRSDHIYLTKWDLTTGAVQAEFEPPPTRIRSAVVTSDGNQVIAIHNDKEVAVYDLSGPDKILLDHERRGFFPDSFAISISRDKTRIAAAIDGFLFGWSCRGW